MPPLARRLPLTQRRNPRWAAPLRPLCLCVCVSEAHTSTHAPLKAAGRSLRRRTTSVPVQPRTVVAEDTRWRRPPRPRRPKIPADQTWTSYDGGRSLPGARRAPRPHPRGRQGPGARRSRRGTRTGGDASTASAQARALRRGWRSLAKLLWPLGFHDFPCRHRAGAAAALAAPASSAALRVQTVHVTHGAQPHRRAAAARGLPGFGSQHSRRPARNRHLHMGAPVATAGVRVPAHQWQRKLPPRRGIPLQS